MGVKKPAAGRGPGGGGGGGYMSLEVTRGGDGGVGPAPALARRTPRRSQRSLTSGEKSVAGVAL